MLVNRQGEIMQGSVGGGLLEAQVIEEAKHSFAESRSSVIRRFECNASSSDEGMICGGSAEVLIELLGKEELSIFSKLCDLRNEGNDCVFLRVVDLSQRVVKRMALKETTDDIAPQPPLDNLLKELQISSDRFIQNLQQAHRQETLKRVSCQSGEIIIEPIIGFQPLIIFGGGHIGTALSKIAATAGFSVAVVDDREEYAKPERFPEASLTLAVPFGKAFDRVNVTPSTSIVIVTRGHQSDREVLEHALSTPARYIGMIGSKRKVISLFERLREQGISLALLKRVHAPIGLDIGAVTAEEIAVSIVAELIRVRRGIHSPSAPLSDGMKQWFDNAEGGPSKRTGEDEIIRS